MSEDNVTRGPWIDPPYDQAETSSFSMGPDPLIIHVKHSGFMNWDSRATSRAVRESGRSNVYGSGFTRRGAIADVKKRVRALVEETWELA